MIRMTLGAILIFFGIINDMMLTFGAAAAAHLNFWQYAMLNKFGIAVLVWGYNPGGVLLTSALILGGFLIFNWGRFANDR